MAASLTLRDAVRFKMRQDHVKKRCVEQQGAVAHLSRGGWAKVSFNENWLVRRHGVRIVEI
jgi:hypothetical protein